MKITTPHRLAVLLVLGLVLTLGIIGGFYQLKVRKRDSAYIPFVSDINFSAQQIQAEDKYKTIAGQGFRITYPITWRETGNSVSLSRVISTNPLLQVDVSRDPMDVTQRNDAIQEHANVWVYSEPNTPTLSLEQFLERVAIDDSRTDVVVDGERGFIAECGGLFSVKCILAIHKDRRFKIEITYFRAGAQTQGDVVEILKDFHFTPSN